MKYLRSRTIYMIEMFESERVLLVRDLESLPNRSDSLEDIYVFLKRLSTEEEIETTQPEKPLNPYLTKNRRPEMKLIVSAGLLPNDILIPKFEYDIDMGKIIFESITAWELKDGRVVIQYGEARYYSTKENIMKLPYPPPARYYDQKPWNSVSEQAAKKYRKYLALQAEQNDPDRKYRPMLNTDTRTNYDGGKIEGDLSG